MCASAPVKRFEQPLRNAREKVHKSVPRSSVWAHAAGADGWLTTPGVRARTYENKLKKEITNKLEQLSADVTQDKTLQRAEALFADTPLAKPSEFSAAIFAVEATEFEHKSNSALMLALAAVVGGMIGVVYVLIARAMRSRREAEAG